MQSKFMTMGIIISLIMLFIMIVLFKIQVLEQSHYRKKVDQIALRKNVLKSLRGRIFDTHADEPLAFNVSAYQIVLDPRTFVRNEKNIENLANALNVSKSHITNTITKSQSRTDEIVIRENLLYKEIIPYFEQINSWEGVRWKRTIQRQYAHDDSMAHVLGYVGDISVVELQTYAYKGYNNADIIGKFGVEKQYEDLLRGKTGTKEEVVNVFGQKIDDTEQIVKEVELGHDLILTLDREIQEVVEKSLGERIGAAIVLKPSTGEIIAMASYPSYNPNQLVYSVDSKLLSEIQRNVDSPFLNRAIQSTAPPASTFKVLMTTILLDLDRNHTLGYWHHRVYCPGYIKIGNRIFRCWLAHGHGYENYISALADSCNVFFYNVGIEQIGINNIFNYASQFGLGQLSAIDLPGEVSGILPSPQWKESRLSESWVTGDTANLSIGQGFMEVTPLQLASMVSGIVNDGVIYKPHVLKEARDQITGKVVYTTPIEELRNIDVDKQVFKSVRSAMRNVAINGTSAVVMTTRAVEVAGKTGSGQVLGDDFENLHSWYMAFGPYDLPAEEQVVVVTWIDAKNKWEWWAPKAANLIFQSIFANQNYEEALLELQKNGAWFYSNL